MRDVAEIPGVRDCLRIYYHHGYGEELYQILDEILRGVIDEAAVTAVAKTLSNTDPYYGISVARNFWNIASETNSAPAVKKASETINNMQHDEDIEVVSKLFGKIALETRSEEIILETSMQLLKHKDNAKILSYKISDILYNIKEEKALLFAIKALGKQNDINGIGIMGDALRKIGQLQNNLLFVASLKVIISFKIKDSLEIARSLGNIAEYTRTGDVVADCAEAVEGKKPKTATHTIKSLEVIAANMAQETPAISTPAILLQEHKGKDAEIIAESFATLAVRTRSKVAIMSVAQVINRYKGKDLKRAIKDLTQAAIRKHGGIQYPHLWDREL